MVRLGDNRKNITDKINRFQIGLGVILRREDHDERLSLLKEYSKRAYDYMNSFLLQQMPLPLEVYDCYQRARIEIEASGCYDTQSIMLSPKQQKEYETRYQSKLELAASD